MPNWKEDQAIAKTTRIFDFIRAYLPTVCTTVRTGLTYSVRFVAFSILVYLLIVSQECPPGQERIVRETDQDWVCMLRNL